MTFLDYHATGITNVYTENQQQKINPNNPTRTMMFDYSKIRENETAFVRNPPA